MSHFARVWAEFVEETFRLADFWRQDATIWLERAGDPQARRHLELKQRVLDAVTPLIGKPGRYRPDDKLLPSSRACGDGGYVPSAYPLASLAKRIMARRDIVRHGT